MWSVLEKVPWKDLYGSDLLRKYSQEKSVWEKSRIGKEKTTNEGRILGKILAFFSALFLKVLKREIWSLNHTPAFV